MTYKTSQVRLALLLSRLLPGGHFLHLEEKTGKKGAKGRH